MTYQQELSPDLGWASQHCGAQLVMKCLPSIGCLKARIPKWFVVPFSSGPCFVRTLRHDPSILGGLYKTWVGKLRWKYTISHIWMLMETNCSLVMTYTLLKCVVSESLIWSNIYFLVVHSDAYPVLNFVDLCLFDGHIKYRWWARQVKFHMDSIPHDRFLAQRKLSNRILL